MIKAAFVATAALCLLAGAARAAEASASPAADRSVAVRPPVAPAARPLSPLLQLYERPGASVDVTLHAPRTARPAATAHSSAVPSATVDLPPSPIRRAPAPMMRQAPRQGFTIARGGAARAPSVYSAAVSGVARMYDIDPLFMGALVRQESGFHAGAVSGKGARGLMQVMPGTARRFGVDGRALENPVVNLAVGAAYLKSLQRRYGNNLPLVLAAYNAGEGAVDRHARRVPPYRETRTYVSSILTQYQTGLSAGVAAR